MANVHLYSNGYTHSYNFKSVLEAFANYHTLRDLIEIIALDTECEGQSMWST